MSGRKADFGTDEGLIAFDPTWATNPTPSKLAASDPKAADVLTQLRADLAKTTTLLDAAENLVIAIGMGWDTGAAVTQTNAAISAINSEWNCNDLDL